MSRGAGKEMMLKTIYCAIPTILEHESIRVMEFVVEQKIAPIIPFNVFPIHYFEKGNFTREETMILCKRLVAFCDEFWAFGMSDGVEEEYQIAKQLGKPIQFFRVFIDKIIKTEPYFDIITEEVR